MIFVDIGNFLLISSAVDGGKAFLQVGDNIGDMFRPDREAHGIRFYALCFQLFLSTLAMCRSRRVYHKGLHIGYICQQREQLQSIDEILGILKITFYVEGEDRAASVREILVIQPSLRFTV